MNTKLQNYILTIESWIWSIVLLPLMVVIKLVKFILKYISFDALWSLFRILWIPLIITIYYSIPLFFKHDFEGKGTIVGFIILISCVTIFFVGAVSLFELLTSSSDGTKNDIEYIKSKGLWKWYK
jgi:hypothetical protein